MASRKEKSVESKKEVRETGIIYTCENVELILKLLKTQTRRVIIPQPRAPYIHPVNTPPSLFWFFHHDFEWERWSQVRCRYGQAGDRLWVRETHGYGWDNGNGGYSALMPTGQKEPDKIIYRADGHWEDTSEGQYCWRSSRFMRRVDSRIDLEITYIHPERLQDISDADIVAEGVTHTEEWLKFIEHFESCAPAGSTRTTERQHFAKSWDRINARRGFPYESNPWVWAITHKLVKQENAKRFVGSAKALRQS